MRLYLVLGLVRRHDHVISTLCSSSIPLNSKNEKEGERGRKEQSTNREDKRERREGGGQSRKSSKKECSRRKEPFPSSKFNRNSLVLSPNWADLSLSLFLTDRMCPALFKHRRNKMREGKGQTNFLEKMKISKKEKKKNHMKSKVQWE